MVQYIFNSISTLNQSIKTFNLVLYNLNCRIYKMNEHIEHIQSCIASSRLLVLLKKNFLQDFHRNRNGKIEHEQELSKTTSTVGRQRPSKFYLMSNS